MKIISFYLYICIIYNLSTYNLNPEALFYVHRIKKVLYETSVFIDSSNIIFIFDNHMKLCENMFMLWVKNKDFYSIKGSLEKMISVLLEAMNELRFFADLEKNIFIINIIENFEIFFNYVSTIFNLVRNIRSDLFKLFCLLSDEEYTMGNFVCLNNKLKIFKSSHNHLIFLLVTIEGRVGIVSEKLTLLQDSMKYLIISILEN